MKEMKHGFLVLLMTCCILGTLTAGEAEHPLIIVSTNQTQLALRVGNDQRLYQVYLGERLEHVEDMTMLPMMEEAYITHGMKDYFEPALQVVHGDGNPSLLLKYVAHEIKKTDDNVTETIVTLKDEVYPFTVNMHYVAYAKENIIKMFTEIRHQEKKKVKLQKYASSMLHLEEESYYLTEYSGDWAQEVNPQEQPLAFGKKILDSKLGTRANMFCSPFFQLALNHTAEENEGEVLVGTLGWTGNFRFTFEVDQQKKLRLIAGINPYFSEYTLKPNEVFRTPDFYFTLTNKGMGEASRCFHDWARNYQLKGGTESRMTLLNNWESTYFNFNEQKLVELMDDARKLGVDMFLLDDGWFGNAYPRSNDHQGLGDWEETKEKLPQGIGFLTKEATEKGVKFGLWIEPEMVNPRSELYKKHKDWVIHLPNRKEYYFRNQMVLDLSNPKVQDYVFGIVDELMTKYPEIAYFKWDCNSPITNIYSEYLKDQQSHLYIDYVRGLYRVLDRINAKYPHLPMMLCSGGGGRTDYEALRYFTEFWPSDNTDPVERLYIQWGFSQVFPAKAMCAHVTSWNNAASIKFRTDVAMMGKLGFDIRLSRLNDKEITFCHDAVANYHRWQPAILEGDLYRLVSPHKTNHTSSMYVSKDKNQAVLFAFDMHPRYGEKLHKVCLQGLEKDKRYQVKEVNLFPGNSSKWEANNKVLSGEYLMKIGLDVFSNGQMRSRVVEITAVKN